MYPTQNSIISRETHDDDPPPSYSSSFDDGSEANESYQSYQQTTSAHGHNTQIRRHRMTTNTTDEYGLIILGNSGVGKSFLANILLGQEIFAHEVKCSSVTHQTDFVEINIGNIAFAIFDIPGLIEADQRRVDSNKKEIDKAFSQRPNSIIIYVFGNQNGRIRDEDVVAFKAINAAYSFRREALVLVVNGLPRRRARHYEGTTLVLLQQLLPNTEINDGNVCFLDSIDPDDERQKQYLKEQLLKVIVDYTPAKHRKQQEIETMSDRLQTEIRKTREQQSQFEIERNKYMKQIEHNQKLLNKTINEHRSETESYQKALRRQEAMFQKQQEKFEREREQYDNQLEALRRKMNQAQANYGKLRKDDRTDNEALEASRKAYKELKLSFDRLAEKIQSQTPTKKHSSCVIS